MSQLTIKQKGNGYAVASVGNLAAFSGKAFLKDALSLTGVEVSFGTLAPGEAVPFNHKHKQNEEVYIVLSGTGVFTLDGADIAVESGDALRIDPNVVRCNRNTGETPFTYICIQAKANSLEQCTATDGVIL